jgi:hypothetical protein
MAERKLPSVDDYPSAAIGEDKPKEKSDDIIKVKKKRSVWKEVKGEFISEDAPSVGSYILYDILLPALRDLVSDIGHGALDMAMGTDGRRYRRNRRGRDETYISYDRYWDYDRPSRRGRSRYDDDEDDYRGRRRSSRRVPSNEDLDEFVFDSKEKARHLLDEMQDRIDKYDDVSVGYFLDRIGESIPGDFVSDDWGWYNLDNAKIKPAYGGGWHIIFPKMRPI